MYSLNRRSYSWSDINLESWGKETLFKQIKCVLRHYNEDHGLVKADKDVHCFMTVFHTGAGEHWLWVKNSI